MFKQCTVMAAIILLTAGCAGTVQTQTNDKPMPSVDRTGDTHQISDCNGCVATNAPMQYGPGFSNRLSPIGMFIGFFP